MEINRYGDFRVGLKKIVGFFPLSGTEDGIYDIGPAGKHLFLGFVPVHGVDLDQDLRCPGPGFPLVRYYALHLPGGGPEHIGRIVVITDHPYFGRIGFF